MPKPRNTANARYEVQGSPDQPPTSPPAPGLRGRWEWVGEQWDGFWRWVGERLEDGQEAAQDIVEDLVEDTGQGIKWTWPIVFGLTALAAIFVIKRL